MLEVVFGDSEKGSLCLAQLCGGKSTTEAVFEAPLTTKGEGVSLEEKPMDGRKQQAKRGQMRRATPMPGRNEDVFCLGFVLGEGDIAGSPESEERKKRLIAWIDADPWGEKLGPGGAAYWRTCVTERKNLLLRASQGEPVRIWYDNTPNAMCGLYETANLLQDASCQIVTVLLPSWRESSDGTVKQATGWGEVPPEEWSSFLPLAHKLTVPMRRMLAARWRQLQAENAPLRAVINGRLQSVPADFYDDMIRSVIPTGGFRMAYLIGTVLGKYQPGVNDFLIARRITRMVATGELKVMQQAESLYATVLCCGEQD